MLTFSRAGSYYRLPVFEFNLPAGHTCPFARDCRTVADRRSGRLSAGPGRVFRCYAAVAERFPGVRKVRWSNYEALLSAGDRAGMRDLLLSSLPEEARNVRIHGSGDFFSLDYFDAWLDVVRARPEVRFWAFTKSLPFWAIRFKEIPPTLTLQASWGELYDELIERFGFKYVRVFPSIEAAREYGVKEGLPVDVDDAWAMEGRGSFALVDNYAKRRKG